MNVLALCAGVGGLELGVHLAEPASRVVCYVEREAFAVACLVRAMEAGYLAAAPVWSDLTSFRGHEWRGLVDCITAGFPCQPWSVAGARRGTADERWIWDSIAGIIRDVGPRFVFLENVPGLLVGGIGHVLGSLASLGFNAEWGVFSCRAVGGSHLRERVFILAYARCQHSGRHQQEPVTGGSRPADPGHGEPAMAHTKGLRRKDGKTQKERQARPASPSPAMVYAHGWEHGGPDGHERARAGEPGERVWPPGPDGDWGAVDPKLWPVEPRVCRVADGASSRLDWFRAISLRLNRLRALGNGVVPLVAAVAWRTLAARAGVEV